MCVAFSGRGAFLKHRANRPKDFDAKAYNGSIFLPFLGGLIKTLPFLVEAIRVLSSTNSTLTAYKESTVAQMDL